MIQEEKMKTLTNKQTTKQTNKQNHPSKKREWNAEKIIPIDIEHQIHF